MGRRRRRGPRRAGGSRGRGVGRGGGRRRIVITSASPMGDVSGSSTTIQAYVEDLQGRLSRDDIDVYLDGQDMRFDYRRATGMLRCPTGNLSKGTHTVEIEAYGETESGGSRTGRKRWTFNIK